MKIKMLPLVLILSVFLYTSCSNDDDSSQAETINGIWNLKNVRGGFLGVNFDFIEGEVVWDFDLENNTLVVENNFVTTGAEERYSGLDSGTYSIQIEQEGETETLFINDIEIGVIILLNTNLQIDEDQTADGFLKEFER